MSFEGSYSVESQDGLYLEIDFTSQSSNASERCSH